MQKITKNWLLTLIMVALVTFSGFAQRKGQSLATTKALLAEITQYRKQHITPVVHAKRLELDQKLSAADRQELDLIRAESARHRQAQLARIRQHIIDRKNRNATLTEEQKAQLKAAREEQNKRMEQLINLAQRNDSLINAIAQELKPLQDKWKADAIAIAAKYGIKPDEKRGFRGRRANFMGQLPYRWNSNRFLLLDPNQPSEQVKFPSSTTLALQVNPNPVKDQAALSFTLEQAGKVRLELLDHQSKAIQQILDKEFKAGQHQHPVQLNTLANGVYYFRITAGANTQVVRFLKQ